VNDLNDLAPTLPDYARRDVDAITTTRRPSMGEFLGASVGEGWWGTTLGTMGALGQVAQEEQRDPTPLDQDAWKASPFFRQGIPYDERMTAGRARALAETFDANRYRRSLMDARNPGLFESVLGFGGQLVGAIPDPLNFVPIAGPAGRGLRAAGAVGAAARLEAPTLGAYVARGVVDATGGNILAAPFIYGQQEQFGEEVTWNRVLTDLAIGALIGAGFGAIGRGLAGRIEPDAAASARIMDAAARDIAAGRPVDVPPAMMRATVEDAVIRAAPPEAAPFVRTTEVDGNVTRALDLPTRPDGKPLTRAEFEEEFARREGMSLDEWRAAKRDERAAEDARRGEQTLVKWIIQNGGLRDDRGDLLSMLGGKTTARIGLINNQARRFTPDGTATYGGMPMDQAAIAAREAGFFNDRRAGSGSDDLSPSDLMDAIDAELRGTGARYADGQGVEPLRRNAPREDATAAAVDDAYGWYQAALDVRARLVAMPAATREAVAERAGVREFEGGQGSDEALVRGAGDVAANDPDLAVALRTVDALRAEGRLNAADEAALRAGDDAAAETESLARGLEEAGACLLRRAA
jgi:hypothetical protein